MASKKTFKIIVPLIALAALGYLVFGMFSKIQQRKEVADRIRQIPEFSFQTLEDGHFNKTHLGQDIPIIFLFFNTGCDFCQKEAEQIERSISEFKTAQLIFVSNEDYRSVKNFAEHHNLLQHDNINILLDPRNNFTKFFGATTIPFTLVYDKNQNLLETFKGFVKVETLLKLIA